MCKIKIREFSLKYSKQKKKITKHFLQKLQQDYTLFNRRVDENPSEENIQELQKTRIKLEKIYKDKCRGFFVRSREKWIEEGEKSTKYFFKLEKLNAKRKEISGI